MPNYKSVRLEEKVYNKILKRMLPRESFSQTVERLMSEMEEIAGHVQAIAQIVGGAQK